MGEEIGLNFFAGLIPFVLIFIVVRTVVRALRPEISKNKAQNNPNTAQNSARQSFGMNRSQVSMQKSAEEQLADIRERARQRLNSRMSAAREQVEYRSGTNRQGYTVPDKPIIEHSTDDCTGGSIHDGYHEGTIRRPAPASSSEGTQGMQGARRGDYTTGSGAQGAQGSEGTSSYRTGPVYQAANTVPTKKGTDRLAEAISSQSGIVQGIIWSEVLGHPRAEQQ